MTTIRRFDLNQGLARVLGELEAKVFDAAWAPGQAAVKDAAAQLDPDVQTKTIMPVMSRMVEKRLLTRKPRGRRFVYASMLDRESFLRQVASRVLTGLLADFGSPTITHIVEGATSEQLAELERLIVACPAGGAMIGWTSARPAAGSIPS